MAPGQIEQRLEVNVELLHQIHDEISPSGNATLVGIDQTTNVSPREAQPAHDLEKDSTVVQLGQPMCMSQVSQAKGSR